MSSYQPGSMIKEVRIRKRLRQEFLLRKSEISSETVSRVENNRQAPRRGALRNILSKIDIENDDFFCPYLHGVSSDVYQMRGQLLLCLDEQDDLNAVKEADMIIKRIENMDGFNRGINLQFLLSCKARYNEIINGEPSVTFDYIKRGLAVTFPEFEINKFSGEVLIFEEAELLHTYALAVKRVGNLTVAIEFLEGVKAGLCKLPEDDIEKEKRLVKVLLTLSECLMSIGDYARALEVCREGGEASLTYGRGKYSPAFLHNKAVCLFHLGGTAESKEAFTLAYFGYSLFHQKKQADKVKNEAEKTAGFKLNTYGVDKINFEPTVYKRTYDKPAVKYNSLGEMLRSWREQTDLPLAELCRGICNASYLYKIESNEIKQPSVYILEALAERLGRDHNLYFNTFVSQEVFVEKQTRNEISASIILHEYEKAEKLLDLLIKSKNYKKGSNLEFIENAKASIFSKGINLNENFLYIVIEALKISIPDFDEKLIYSYHLTHIEKMLINKLSNYFASNGELPRAIKIMEQLIENVNRIVLDESEKLRSIGMLLYNYSKMLGNAKRNQEELNVAEEGIEITVKHRQMLYVPGLYINKAAAIFRLCCREESIPYFAMAYYGSVIVNNKGNRKNIADFVNSELGITFD